MAACLPAAEIPKTSAELFQETRVWNVQLTFTAEQWKAIEPAQGWGARGPGPGRFDPSSMLAASFVQAGDGNGDGKLASEEWSALGGKWFRQWSAGKESVSLDLLGEAAGKSLMGMPGGGPVMGGIPKSAEYPEVHAAIDFEGMAFEDVAVRYKGNSSFQRARNSIKKSFKIDLNKYVKGQKIGGVSTINLHNDAADPSWMNEALSYRLYRDAGVPAPRTSYARVYVTVPGLYSSKYFGLYSVVENIDNSFLKDRFQTKDGLLLKPSLPDLFHDAGADWAKYQGSYDPKDEVTRAQAQRVIDFSRLVTHAGDEEFAAKAGSFLDVEKFARYMAVTVWLSTLDSILALGHNYYVYLNPVTDKFEFLPWDMDQSFGQFGMGGGGQASLNIFKPWQGQKRFLERVFALPEFQAAYRKDLETFGKGIFAADRIAAQVDELAPVLRPSVARESEPMLKNFDKLAAGESIERTEDRPPGGGPEPAEGRPGMSRSLGSIKSFVAEREKSVRAQLAGEAPAAAGEMRGPGGPPGFGGGPDRMLARFFADFDADKDGMITVVEFGGGFSGWFQIWDADKDGLLTAGEIETGLKGRLPSGPPGQREKRP